MKKVAILLLFLPCIALSQTTPADQEGKSTSSNQKTQKNKTEKKRIGIGIKGGLNFANVTNAADINNSSRTGFMGGVYFTPPSKSIISSRTELIFSRQGYNFKTNTSTGQVDLDYIILPQLMGINITKYVQLQIGFQMAYLINAKADSTTSTSSAGPYAKVMDYYNRFDYGAAGGIEIHPIGGLLIGARFNVSFGDIYKDPTSIQGGGTTPPSYFPSVNAKNNVLQLYLGWTF